jgi:peroxiredoxin
VRKPALFLSSFALAVSFSLAGCSEPASNSTPTADSSAAQAAPTPAVAASPARETRGRPIPAFDGIDLSGAPLAIQSLLGKRFLLFGFNPELPAAKTVAAAMRALAGERSAANFQLVGVSAASTLEKTTAFAKDAGLDFPIFFDPNAELMNRIGLRSPVWVLLVDADGNVIQGSDYFPTDVPDPVTTVEHMLRDYLRLPHETPAPADPSGNPTAPDFSASRLGGGAPITLSSLRGKPALLMFFLHTCPHCHDALSFLKEELEKLDEKERPPLVGISISNAELAVKEALERDDLDFFEVAFDPDTSIRNKYGATQGVPVLLLIDAEGRITARTNGWREDRDPALTRMRLARLVGKQPPMLLSQSGYSGNDFCAVCHPSETETWRLTQHATALDTLVRQGADGRAECVSCHVVGYGKPGGFAIARPEKSLENVGCETCHGRGGPHLSPDHVAGGNYESACASCHTPEHSLGFDYARFQPRISHAELAKLSPEARAEFVAAHGKPREDLLPANVASVGSETCASCHASEFAKWKAHPHAQATPEVSCESCHGGGANHVAEGAARKGTITSLADKCGSCAILQVCGTCHDDAREPEFQFQIREKIEHQRHSDRPLQGLVQRTLPAPTLAGLIDAALPSRAVD